MFDSLLRGILALGQPLLGMTPKYEAYYIEVDHLNTTTTYATNSCTTCTILYQKHTSPFGFFQFDEGGSLCKIGAWSVTQSARNASAEVVKVMMLGNDKTNHPLQ